MLVPVNRSDTESIQFQTMTLVQHELKPNHYQIAENCTLSSVAMRKNESLYLKNISYPDDLCMNNLAVRGEGQDVVTHLTTAGSDDEYSIRVSE